MDKFLLDFIPGPDNMICLSSEIPSVKTITVLDLCGASSSPKLYFSMSPNSFKDINTKSALALSSVIDAPV